MEWEEMFVMASRRARREADLFWAELFGRPAPRAIARRRPEGAIAEQPGEDAASATKTYRDMPPKPFRDAGHIFGVDIYFQNTRRGKALDRDAFTLLKAHAKDFVVSKCSHAANDPAFPVNYALTRQLGMIRGSYHFFNRNQNDILKRNVTVEDQVAFIVWQVPRLGPGDVAPALDLEDSSRALNRHYGYLSKATGADQLVTDCQQWLDDVEAKLGRTPLYYTGVIWDDLQGKPWRAQSAVEYPLWTVRRGRLPGKWSEDDVVIYQYAANDAKEAGATEYPFTRQYGLDTNHPYNEGTLDIEGIDFDYYRGTMYDLRGLAEMERPGVVMSSGGPLIAHRALDGAMHLTSFSGGVWRDRVLGGVTGAEDPYLVAKGGDLYAYHRFGDGGLKEAVGTAAGAFAVNDLTGVSGLEGVKVFHDPRVVLDGARRHVVFWGTSEDGWLGKDPRRASDDWYLLTHDGTRWSPARRLLQLAGGGIPASGQPIPFLRAGELHVVGRAGTDGHLYDVWVDARGAVHARDLFADARFSAPPIRQAATYSPTIYSVGAETHVAFRGLRGDLWQMQWGSPAVLNLSVAGSSPKHAVGHPTSFTSGNRPHIVFRAVDRAVYDVSHDGSQWITTKVPCDREPIADPVASSDGAQAVVAYRAMDGGIIAARFDGSRWMCAEAFRPARA